MDTSRARVPWWSIHGVPWWSWRGPSWSARLVGVALLALAGWAGLSAGWHASAFGWYLLGALAGITIWRTVQDRRNR